MAHQAILLPGIVLPAQLAYADLLEALGEAVDARPKELEIYADDEPPPGYGLELEIASILRMADRAGFDRFHLVGYSGGGAICATLAGRHPERVRSLALLEPAWMGNEDLSDAERRVRAEFARIRELPADEMMPRFVAAQLAPGVEPPPPPPGPTPPWMAKRPAGISAITAAFDAYDLDPAALRAFANPVYYALGELSNPDYFGAMAERLRGVFPDYTLEVYPGRHHFDPPHRVEPGRLASRLTELWTRSLFRK